MLACVTTEIGRVKCWISTEGLRQKEVLDRETGMVYDVRTTTTTTTTHTHTHSTAAVDSWLRDRYINVGQVFVG